MKTLPARIVARSRSSQACTVSLHQSGVCLVPGATEVSVAALACTAANPAALSTGADVLEVIGSFWKILALGWLPGRHGLICDLAWSPSEGFSAQLGFVAVGSSNTRREAESFRDAAMRLLVRYPAPFACEAVAPAALLTGSRHRHAVAIIQDEHRVYDDELAAAAPGSFFRVPDPLTALAGLLTGSRVPVRLRTCLLATTPDIADHRAIEREIQAATAIVMRGARGGPLVRRAARVHETLLHLRAGFDGPMFVGDVLLLSAEPLPEPFARGVAGCLTSERDLAHPALLEGGNGAIRGGYRLEFDPPRVAESIAIALPLRGGIGPHRIEDLFPLAQAACVFQWPIPAGGPIPTMPTAAAAVLAPTPRVAKGGVVLGRDALGRGVRLGDDDRVHAHLLGVSGTGKTTLLERMAEEEVTAGRFVAVVDPHGDLAPLVCTAGAASGRTVRRVGPRGDVQLALFDTSDPRAIERSVAHVADAATSHLPADWHGPRYKAGARAALTLLAHGGKGLDVSAVSRILTDGAFADALAKRAPNLPDGVREYLATFRQMREAVDIATWISSKFEDLAAQEAMRAIFAPIGSGTTLEQLLAEGEPLVVDLGGGLGASDLALAGHLVIAGLLDAAFARGPRRRADLTLIVDEAHAFPARNLERALHEGRKFGVRLVLANQSLAQWEPRLREAVIGGSGLRFAFRLTPRDAEAMSQVLSIPSKDLAGQPDMHAYVSGNGTSFGGAPFSLHVRPRSG